MFLSPQDRQLILPTGRIQTAGMLVGGVESAYAVGFDGADDYIQSSSKLTLSSAVTVSVWVNSSISTSDRVIVAQTDFMTGDAFVLFWRRNASTDIRFRVGNASTTASATGVVPSTGVWHHLVGTYDGSTVSLYVDGRLVGTASLTGTIYDSANTTLRIGEYGAGASHSSQFGGKIDELRIYNRALTADEISSIYNNTTSPPTSGLVCYFPLDEGTGTTVTDTIGGLTGTLTNGPTWQTQVCPRLRSGRDTTQSWGVSFDGVTDYVAVAANANLPKVKDSWTACGWMKLASTASQYVLISKGSGTDNFWLGYDGANARFRVDLTGNSVNVLRLASNFGGAVVDVWYFVAATYNAATNTLTISVNGANAQSSTGPALINTENGVLAIGRRAPFSDLNLNGNAKGVQFYNSVLSDADLIKLANNQSITATPVGHWKLDDGTSTTATDSSGNGNHGTLTNGPTWTGDIPQHFRPTIESSHAASFDGVDGVVAVTATTPGTADASYSAWLNPQSFPSGTNRAAVIGSNGSNAGALLLRGSVELMYSFGGTSTAVQGHGGLSGWHLLTVTRSGATIKFYKDGVLLGTQTVANASHSAVYDRFGFTASGTDHLAAIIDELWRFNRVLSAPEIADAAAGYLVTAGLVSRYKLDGNANDSAGSNHGTEQGGVSYSSNVPGIL